MSVCRVIYGNREIELEFTGTPLLSELLERSGVRVLHPCGGNGRCGKCAVASASGNISDMSEEEKKFGKRLSCKLRLLGDAKVEIPSENDLSQIETEGLSDNLVLDSKYKGYGAAIDIGTTTVAASLFSLETGKLIRSVGIQNPQTRIAADVMSRIDSALQGKGTYLQELILDTIRGILNDFSSNGSNVTSVVITGNTTMLYLLTGKNPLSLSKAPFEADCLFDIETDLFGKATYYPPCMNAFVGADISCAVLFSGQCDSSKTTLLCDIGTNGELALKKSDRLYVTSTAAGPAFEGAGISRGTGSIEGAIDKVSIEEGKLIVHTIGEKTPVGICGSGIVDAIASLLDLGVIDELGTMVEEEVKIAPGINLTRADVSALQLAKAAIAAGIQTLLESSDTGLDEIETVYIAGGFGKHLNPESVRRIGLLPEALIPKCRVIGNASLKGASMILLNQAYLKRIREIAGMSSHVNLGGNPAFNMNYMEQMLFPEK